MGRKKARRSNAANTAIRLITLKPQAQPAETRPVGEAEIAFRAYSMWLARGCPIGDDARDWFAAQSELERERQAAPRLHAVV